MGLQATFILGPPGLVSRDLGRRWFKAKGLFPGPITLGMLRWWVELHVDTGKRWGSPPREAIVQYRRALECDLEFLCDWTAENGRVLTFSGFVRWPAALLDRLNREDRLIILQGPLRPYQPRLWTRPWYEALQERMFGGVLTTKDRTDTVRWWTVVVLPSPKERS